MKGRQEVEPGGGRSASPLLLLMMMMLTAAAAAALTALGLRLAYATLDAARTFSLPVDM